MSPKDWYELLGKLMLLYQLSRQAAGLPIPMEHVEDRGDEEIVWEVTCVRRRKVSSGG